MKRGKGDHDHIVSIQVDRSQYIFLVHQNIFVRKRYGLRKSRCRKAFKEALANDMNSSEALAVLFDLVRQGNKAPAGRGDSILSLLKEWDQVLGFVLPEVEEVPAWIVDKANKRIVARKEKNWALADTLRNEVDAAGYIVEDNTDGSFSLKKR